jgi:IS30 family transposase
MSSDTRLTLAEREEISRQLAAGSSLQAMARQLGRAPSTIGRELRRAERTRSTYRATRGRHVAGRHAQRPRKLLTHPSLQAYVHAQLKQRWSPEQMATRLKAAYPDDPTMRVSHETIYTYVYVRPRGELKRTLLRALRQPRRARRARRAQPERRGTIPVMLSIVNIRCIFPTIIN